MLSIHSPLRHSCPQLGGCHQYGHQPVCPTAINTAYAYHSVKHISRQLQLWIPYVTHRIASRVTVNLYAQLTCRRLPLCQSSYRPIFHMICSTILLATYRTSKYRVEHSIHSAKGYGFTASSTTRCRIHLPRRTAKDGYLTRNWNPQP